MPLESAHHHVVQSEIVWIIKSVLMKSVSQGVAKIANVLNFMSAVEVFVLWRKNAVQTMIVPLLNLVLQPFQGKLRILDNVRRDYCIYIFNA